MAENRVWTSISFETPETGIWIMVRLVPGRRSVRVAERDMSHALADKIGEGMRRRDGLRTGWHTWITVTWCADDSDDTSGLARVVAAIFRSLAKVGIDAKHAHITPQVVPSAQLVPTHARPIGELPRVGSRVELDLIQPKIGRSVRRTHAINSESVPGASRDLTGYSVHGWQDLLQCPVDHGATVPANEMYAIWSRARKRLAANKYQAYPVHAELIASRRCPACPSEELEDASPMRAPNGQERSSGNCPCCKARWLTDESDGWACLETGRLSMVSGARIAR